MAVEILYQKRRYNLHREVGISTKRPQIHAQAGKSGDGGAIFGLSSKGYLKFWDMVALKI
jgi:hypothetical protein